ASSHMFAAILAVDARHQDRNVEPFPEITHPGQVRLRAFPVDDDLQAIDERAILQQRRHLRAGRLAVAMEMADMPYLPEGLDTPSHPRIDEVLYRKAHAPDAHLPHGQDRIVVARLLALELVYAARGRDFDHLGPGLPHVDA